MNAKRELREVRRAPISSSLAAGDDALVLSGVLHLSSFSQLHVGYGLARLDARVRPTLRLGQFVFCTDITGAPAAFCNWAWLSKEVLADLLATGRDLRADEFACGDLPFFYEFLAPFGHVRAAVRLVQNRPELRGRTIPALRAAKGGTPSAIARVGRFSF